jgi:hypothetical protein
VTHRKAEKERQFAGGRGNRAESYDRKKAWVSINQTILSGFFYEEFSIETTAEDGFPSVTIGIRIDLPLIQILIQWR